MIHRHTTARRLGVVRAYVFGIWLFVVVRDPLSPLAGLPEGLHAPVGVLRLLPAPALDVLTSLPAFVSLDVALPLLLVCAAVGVRPYRLVAVSAAGTLLIHQSLLRGYSGPIGHGEIALLCMAFVLATFPAADGFSWPARERGDDSAPRYVAALLLMAAALLCAYSSIGTHRLVHGGGPAVFFDDSFAHNLAHNGFRASHWGFRTPATWVLASPTLLMVMKAGFAVTTLFEILAPLCLVFRKFRWVWLAVMVPFHVSTLFLMNIFFWEHLLLFPVLLVDARAWSSSTRWLWHYWHNPSPHKEAPQAMRPISKQD